MDKYTILEIENAGNALAAVKTQRWGTRSKLWRHFLDSVHQNVFKKSYKQG